jgi:hypothetical protein
MSLIQIHHRLTIMKLVQHHEIKGLQLVHGQVVIITGQWSKDWYHGRVPNGTESHVFPCDHVRIIKCEVSIPITARSVS